MPPFRIFDTDQHITEPPDMWTKHLPKKYQADAPHLITHPTLGQGWIFGDKSQLVNIGLQSTGSEDPRRHTWARSYEDLDPACWDPKKRVEVMDIDGVGATLLFPSVTRNIATYQDEMYLACLKAYNDGVLEWAKEGDAQRILPAALMPSLGIEESVAELERVAKKGFRHYMFNQFPSGKGSPSSSDDRFWSLLQDTGMVVSFHGFGQARAKPAAPKPGEETKERVMRAQGRSQEMTAASRGSGLGSTAGLAAFVFSGVMERFPKLKVSLIETSVGWVPSFMEQMDQVYLNQRWLLPEQKLNRLPSDYVRDFYINFDREWLGVKYRDYVGPDKVTFGTDFPHIGSFYPHSRFYLELVLRDVPDAERERMVWTNAARLYGADSVR